MALLHRARRDTASRSPQPPQRGAGPEAAGLAPGADQAFWVLRSVFTVAPIAFGLDKFSNLLVDWPVYLAPWIDGIVPGTAQQAMWAVGVVEVVAGLLVAWRPAIGGYVVAAWLAGIVLNLVSTGSYLDVALRDVGLLGGAVALALLARARAARR